MLTFVDTIERELTSLRLEMRELKNCQLRYFTLSVFSSGAIIGGRTLFSTVDVGDLAPLVALIVILPCWLTFFDKATTITRIIAYIRILERIRINPGQTSVRYVGFETALRMFRNYEDTNGPSGEIKLREGYTA